MNAVTTLLPRRSSPTESVTPHISHGAGAALMNAVYVPAGKDLPPARRGAGRPFFDEETRGAAEPGVGGTPLIDAAGAGCLYS
jgi:hypothetical protein